MGLGFRVNGECSVSDPAQYKWMKKCAGLAQEIVFGSA